VAEVEAMSTVISISMRRRYGIARTCRMWGVSRAGIYRGREATITPSAPRRRPGPQGPMPDAALVDAIRHDSPFYGEGYRKVWARLRHAGLRTSKERVRRLMRENGLSAATSRGCPRGPRNHDGTIIPETVDTMWGTDMTATVTAEHGQVAVFVAVDHASAECVGIHAALNGTRHEALEPVRQGVAERFGGIAADAAKRLSIRHDHGSQYMSRDFQREIAWLGATSSPAFVRAPEGNGCAERFIRTLKENLLWVRTFRTVEELRLALIAFRRTYNEHWLIERHGHRSPAQFRRDQMDTIPLAA
jgi:putative transposase